MGRVEKSKSERRCRCSKSLGWGRGGMCDGPLQKDGGGVQGDLQRHGEDGRPEVKMIQEEGQFGK